MRTVLSCLNLYRYSLLLTPSLAEITMQRSQHMLNSFLLSSMTSSIDTFLMPAVFHVRQMEFVAA